MRRGRIIRRFVDGLSILVVLVALAVVARPYLQNRIPRNPGVHSTNETDEWFYELAATGNWIGLRDAPVVVLVFSTYHCGFCAEFNDRLSTIRSRYPEHVATVFKHFVPPNSISDSNVELGAECAAEQGRFHEYHFATFQHGQLKNYTNGWRSLADSAGVQDLVDFEVCVRGRRYGDKIFRDYEAGKKEQVSATPTFFINGQGPFKGAMPTEGLDSLVTGHFRGRSPSEDGAFLP